MRPEQAIIGALATAQASAQAPANITEAIKMFGGGARGKSAIAQELAGTGDKKSKEYKAALRNVERYYKAESGEGGQGRRPRAAMQEKLRKLGEAQAKASVKQQMRAQGASVKTSGDVKVSNDERYRDLPELYIFPEEMAAILDAYDAGNFDRMADEMNAALFEAYDVRRAVLTNVDGMDITAGMTAGAMRYDVINAAQGR